jgi:hypothetical protein
LQCNRARPAWFHLFCHKPFLEGVLAWQLEKILGDGPRYGDVARTDEKKPAHWERVIHPLGGWRRQE